MKRNPHFELLTPTYLFPEVQRRAAALPQEQLINLGIGDTTAPLPKAISQAMAGYASDLATLSGYSGYGPEEGWLTLRQKIATTLYGDTFGADELFISDGIGCDLGRLLHLFCPTSQVALPDPAYPGYGDSTSLAGYRVSRIPCAPDDNFFPDPASLPPADILYLCSPNNPTGTCATRDQLASLVQWARHQQALIIFDAAYASFVQDGFPRSIYEIEGAREVAIELGSFSKGAGFSGVRLSWSVVPRELCWPDGRPVNPDWRRTVTTLFNGPSNVAQAGGLACLTPEGQEALQRQTSAYLEHASILASCLQELDVAFWGGDASPYIWCRFPGKDSWEIFDALLHQAHLITTPGVGFGPAGEGYIRLSAFAKRDHVEEAAQRLRLYLR